jgi:hypothetical protein
MAVQDFGLRLHAQEVGSTPLTRSWSRKGLAKNSTAAPDIAVPGNEDNGNLYAGLTRSRLQVETAQESAK